MARINAIVEVETLNDLYELIKTTMRAHPAYDELDYLISHLSSDDEEDLMDYILSNVGETCYLEDIANYVAKNSNVIDERYGIE